MLLATAKQLRKTQQLKLKTQKLLVTKLRLKKLTQKLLKLTQKLLRLTQKLLKLLLLKLLPLKLLPLTNLRDYQGTVIPIAPRAIGIFFFCPGLLAVTNLYVIFAPSIKL